MQESEKEDIEKRLNDVAADSLIQGALLAYDMLKSGMSDDEIIVAIVKSAAALVTAGLDVSVLSSKMILDRYNAAQKFTSDLEELLKESDRRDE